MRGWVDFDAAEKKINLQFWKQFTNNYHNTWDIIISILKYFREIYKTVIDISKYEIHISMKIGKHWNFEEILRISEVEFHKILLLQKSNFRKNSKYGQYEYVFITKHT